MKKIVTVIGARPQFIKAAPLSKVIRLYYEEKIIHTGQHYDKNMSDIFFKELNIPAPDYNLGVQASGHGEQTGLMMIKIEKILIHEQPDAVLVYGDTNSTLAGALAAAKLHIPVIHVEAGLRSFNISMPEEINRVVVDHLSHLLFCPTSNAVDQLKKENIHDRVFETGDIMYDAVLTHIQQADQQTKSVPELPEDYLLVTVHRAENTDSPEKMKNIIDALSNIKQPKVWPMHPRTKKALETFQIDVSAIPNVIILPPVGYLTMLNIEKQAEKIITDSGGVQKEAYFLNVPCITLRNETEWPETLVNEANLLVGTDSHKIIEAVNRLVTPSYPDVFGKGDTAMRIVDVMRKVIG